MSDEFQSNHSRTERNIRAEQTNKYTIMNRRCDVFDIFQIEWNERTIDKNMKTTWNWQEKKHVNHFVTFDFGVRFYFLYFYRVVYVCFVWATVSNADDDWTIVI